MRAIPSAGRPRQKRSKKALRRHRGQRPQGSAATVHRQVSASSPGGSRAWSMKRPATGPKGSSRDGGHCAPSSQPGKKGSSMGTAVRAR